MKFPTEWKVIIHSCSKAPNSHGVLYHFISTQWIHGLLGDLINLVGGEPQLSVHELGHHPATNRDEE